MDKRTEIGSIGEFGLINRLAQAFDSLHPWTSLGIGDDAALLQADGMVVVSTTELLLLLYQLRKSFALEDVKVDMTVTLANVFDGVSESLGLILPDIEDDAGAVAFCTHAFHCI